MPKFMTAGMWVGVWGCAGRFARFKRVGSTQWPNGKWRVWGLHGVSGQRHTGSAVRLAVQAWCAAFMLVHSEARHLGHATLPPPCRQPGWVGLSWAELLTELLKHHPDAEIMPRNRHYNCNRHPSPKLLWGHTRNATASGGRTHCRRLSHRPCHSWSSPSCACPHSGRAARAGLASYLGGCAPVWRLRRGQPLRLS